MGLLEGDCKCTFMYSYIHTHTEVDRVKGFSSCLGPQMFDLICVWVGWEVGIRLPRLVYRVSGTGLRLLALPVEAAGRVFRIY